MTSYTAIINPVSGGGVAREKWREVEPLLRARIGGADASAAIEAVESASAAHATELAAAAARRGRIVVSVGGDGHTRHVARGLVGLPDAVLGIVGAGRGNDLIRHLGLPIDAAGAVEVLAGRATRRIDVISVAAAGGEAAGHQLALGNVYVGLDSRAAEGINRSRWMGGAAYRIVPALTALRWNPPRFTVAIDGNEVFANKAHLVVVANSGDYGNGLRIVPSADVSNGRLDVLVVGAGIPLTQLVPLMKQAKTGAHIEHPEVIQFSGSTVTVDAESPVPVHADGDGIGELPFTATLRPAELEVLVASA